MCRSHAKLISVSYSPDGFKICPLRRLSRADRSNLLYCQSVIQMGAWFIVVYQINTHKTLFYMCEPLKLRGLGPGPGGRYRTVLRMK